MNNLYEWAARWAIPPAAMGDLLTIFTSPATDTAAPNEITTEAGAQAAIRLEASSKGGRLWRNNVGATMDDTGNFLRFGLCNDSKQMNEMIKSSDLIGVRPITVGGCVVGQFIAREVKPPGWTYKGTKREKAQLKFLNLVAALGGDAAFVTGKGSI